MSMGSKFWQDICFGVKLLLKRLGLTFIAIITLGVGIGVNTAIFSVVNAVMWRSLPYQQPKELVIIWERSKKEKFPQPSPIAPALFLELRSRKEPFTDVAAFEDVEVSHRPRFFLTGGNEPERIAGAYVSGNLFTLLGVNAALGRTFTVEEEQPGREQVVIISDAFWRRRFNATPDVVSKTIQLNDKSFTVIGVMPPEFKFSYPKETELWSPLAVGQQEKADWDGAAYKIIARLKPGVTISQAQETTTRTTQQLLTPHRKNAQDLYTQLVPLHEHHFGEMRKPLLLLLAAVAAVLLIACVNVASLSLARAMDRYKEFAVRAALGANRWRLVRQLLTESLILSALGGIIGLLLAFWGRNLLVGLIPSSVPRSSDIKIDLWVLGFTSLLSILAGVLSGLLPALQVTRQDLNASLKPGAHGATAQTRTHQWHDWLIVAETALLLLLLIEAGLMIRSLWQLHRVEIGFDPNNVLAMNFTIPSYKFNPDKTKARKLVMGQERAFIERIVERVELLPGVVTAAATSSIPLRGSDYSAGFDIAGRPGRQYSARLRVVSNDYFSTMGIPLLKGRMFTQQDTLLSGRVAIVTQELVRKYFPNEDPLGVRLDPSDLNAEIIGVVADVRHKRPDQLLEPAFYLPLSQDMSNPISLVVRAEGDPLQLAPAVRRAVWAEDKNQPLEEIATMAQIRSESVADSKFISIVMAAFAVIALLLGAIGICGVISYSVARRTSEIGVRMALGAGRLAVLQLILAKGMKLVLLGIAIGIIISLGLTRLIKSLLFGVSATDPLMFAAIAVLLTLVALLACWIPARRATKVDPLQALRHE